jgi:hypothetical protein
LSVSLGLLALLHPEGGAGRPTDLVTFGPEASETDIRAAARALAPDGVLCVMPRPARRRKTMATLRAHGIEIRQSLLLQRTPDGSERLFTLRREVLRHIREWRYLPGVHTLLRDWHPHAILVGRRPGARPTAHWALPEQEQVEEPWVLVRVKRRKAQCSTVLQLFKHAGNLIAVAKLASDEDRILREAQLLIHLGADVRASGAELPYGRVIRLPAGGVALVVTALQGQSADRHLARRRIRVDAFIDRLADWLERWAEGTRRMQVIDRAWLDREVLAPAETLRKNLAGSTGYLDWLRARCAGIEGRSMPLVATHGDLTASNILLLQNGRLGVVDWESAREGGLALGDLAYGIVDAVWATGDRRNRVEAFESCFEPGGRHWEISRWRVQQLKRVLKMTEDFALVCLHASWLQHAVSEGRKRRADEAHPFLGIVQRLVQRHRVGFV